MSIIKLFKKGPGSLCSGRDPYFSLLETEMSVFMLDPDVEVLKVNGPYVSYLPPEKNGLPERVFYTASIEYHKKNK